MSQRVLRRTLGTPTKVPGPAAKPGKNVTTTAPNPGKKITWKRKINVSKN